MKKFFLSCAGLSLVVGLAGCGPAGDEGPAGPQGSSDVEARTARTAGESPTALTSGVLKDNMDTSVRPQDDFYRYVNGAWLGRTEIPAERVRWGSSYQIIEKNEQRIKTILEETAADADATAGSDVQKIGDFFTAYMDRQRADTLGLEPLAARLAAIEAVQDHADLLPLFGWMTRHGQDSPFGFYVDRDRENTQRYLFYLWQGGLGLPDRDYYLRDDEKFGQIRSDYEAYIRRILELSGLAGSDQAASNILGLETQMAAAHWPKEKTRDRLATYNLMDREQLRGLGADFDWDAYLGAAGLADTEELVVGTPSFFEGFADLYRQTDLETWRQYLRFKLLDSHAYYLGQEFFDTRFEFYGRKLRGQEQPLERWQYAVNQVNALLGDAMGRIYLDKYFPAEAKIRTEAMVENLRVAFRESIDALEWMSEETKAEARNKLAALRVYVGYPGHWRNYDALEIRPDDLVGNRLRALAHDYDYELGKLASGPVDGEFGLPTQSFNAYYRPTAGELVFLAGFLQPPMFDLAADDAVNYGALGRVIGHEVSHAFDDQGRKVDEKGENRDWWTEADAARYETLAQKLAAQYEEFEPLEGLHINGQLTLGENIADLAGTIVAYRAYLKSLDGKEPPVIDGFTGAERFFIGASQINRSKLREGYLREMLLSDPHSPPEYRTTGVVPNMTEFYAVFDVKPGDGHYRDSADRVRIW